MNLLEDMRNDIVSNLMDDEVWNRVTDPSYVPHGGYCPVQNWDRDISRLINRMAEFDDQEWGYSVDGEDFCAAYEEMSGYITTPREVAGSMEGLRLQGSKIVSQFHPIEIEKSEEELQRIEGATQYQEQVILHERGNMIVNATSGAGKTYAIANLVALKIQKEIVPAERVAMITFTRKAANVMRDRLSEIIGENQARNIKINTFHGIGLYLLNSLGELAPWYEDEDTKIDVVDEAKSVSILKEITDEHAEVAYHYIQRHKLGIENIPRSYRSAMSVYNDYLSSRNLMDYSDLLEQLIMLCDESEVEAFIQDQFDLVVVDEYQDCNDLQAEIARLLAAPYGDLVVVGDADQAIMEFQGGNVQNMIDFHKNHESVQKVFLPDNFRSKQPIFDSAIKLIKNNENRIDKPMNAIRKDNSSCITVKGCYGFRTQVDYVRSTIENWISDGLSYNDIAILGRTNALLTDFYEELVRTIPCDYGRTVNFFDRKEIKDLHAYLRLLDDELHIPSFIRISKNLAGVGAKTVDSIVNLMRADLTIEQILQDPAFKASKKAIAALSEHSEMMRSIREQDLYVKESLQKLIEISPFMKSIEKDAPRVDNVYKLLDIVEDYMNLSDYFENLDYVEYNDDLVSISTFHKAKGREWDRVIIVGCNEGLIPHSRSNDIESERRCFFVGITRAENELVLMYDQNRKPSRFLREIRS